MKRLYGDERSMGAVAFLEEVVRLSKEYGYVLGHEDYQGSFEVRKRPPGDKTTRYLKTGADYDLWLRTASEVD